MSFGQELKDFVGAATATYKMAADRTDRKDEKRRQALMDPIDIEAKQTATDFAKKRVNWYDREMESTLASQASSRAAQASAIQTAEMQRQWYPTIQQSMLDAREAAIRRGEDEFILGMLNPGQGKTPPPVIEGNEYLGIGEGYEGNAMPEDEDLVPGYAEGGLVEEEPQAALPNVAPIPARRPEALPVTPEVTTPPDTSGMSNKERGWNMAYEAVREGALWQLAQMGLVDESAVQDPERAAKTAEFLRGRGAAPKAIIDQAYDVVDPDKSLPESERVMAALSTVYNHYIKRGEPEKAKAAAASIVQHQRNMFQTYASIAKAAMEGGNIEGGLEAAVRAYSSVPDGKDMKAVKTKDGRYAIEIKDEATGKTTHQQVYSPQEIGGFVMNVNPASFDEFIMGAAGERESGGGENAIKSPTYEQTNETREGMSAVWDTLAEETVPDSDEPAIIGMTETPPKERGAIESAATDIMGNPQNRGDTNIAPRDALEIAITMSQTEDYDMVERDKGFDVTLPDGRSAWVPQKTAAAMKRLYTSHKKKSDKAANEAMIQERMDRAAALRAARQRDQVAASRRADTGPQPVMGVPVPRGATPPSAPPAGASTMGIPMGVDNPTQRSIDWLDQLLGQ